MESKSKKFRDAKNRRFGVVNANRVEIRATYGGVNRFNILTTPLRRMIRLGFIEEKI